MQEPEVKLVNINDITFDIPNAAKLDKGKPQLCLVPRQIIFDVAEVREYGVKKYSNPDNWKRVELERYRNALFRHFMAYLDDPGGVDKESGIEHYKHMACNMAFICALEKENKDGRNGTGNAEGV